MSGFISYSENSDYNIRIRNLMSRQNLDIRCVSDLGVLRREMISQQGKTIVIDLDATRRQAIELVNNINRRRHNKALVFMSAQVTEATKLQAYQSGADLFLQKTIDAKEMVARLEALDRRIRRQPYAYVAATRYRKLRLTRKENLILNYFLANPRKVLTRHDLATAIGIGDEASRGLINVHLHNIRKKFAQLGRDDIISTIPGQGYKFNLNLTN